MEGMVGPSMSLEESTIDSKKHVEVEQDCGGLTSSSQVQHGPYRRVTAGELVQAMHELLSTAGVNIDVEKQSLLQDAILLQQQLDESRLALLLEQRAEAATKEADAAKAAWIFRVCLSGEVDAMYA